LKLKKNHFLKNGKKISADPSIFNHDDIFFKKMSAMEIWKRDEDRIKKIKDLGYKVFIFWENTIHFDPEYIKQTILRSIK